jgi:2-keto-4-pentenoate hydratase/quercetin dioxygenase-like cupin family protein
VKPYRTRIEDVPLEQGLREDEGWIDMRVQFLIGEHNAGAKDLVVGRTVLPPGARHERHLHRHCDEFLVVLSGRGEIYTNTGREPSEAGDVIYTPRGNWHGFDNTSDEEVLLLWGWTGAGSLEASGYAIDDRIPTGMRDQLAIRDERLRAGERQIGWKVGFGAPAAMEMLAIDRPLVGFLMERGLLDDGAEVAVGAWTKPMLEAEIAVHLARDVPGDASWDEVRDAIGGLSAAIELADLDPPPQDVRAILAGNIFHRHVVLGPVDRDRSTGEGIDARVLIDDEEVAATDDPAALTGELVEVVRLTAETLAACDERLRAGEVVITGSALPPQPVAPGQRIEVALGPLGRLSLRLT